MSNINVIDEGADPTGVQDSSNAFQRAAGKSVRNRAQSVYCPVGEYRIDQPMFWPIGLPLRGDGCVSSFMGDGTWLKLNTPDGDPSALINYTGAQQYRGSGGLLQDLNLARMKGKNGGTAIRYVATAPDKRCAWPRIRDVKIYSGSDAGNFDYGLVIDGSAVSIPGGSGVRDITCDNLSVQGCRKDAVSLKGAVNGRFVGGEIDPGGTQFIPGFRISQGCQALRFIGVCLYGQMFLDHCDRIKILGCELSAIPILGQNVTNLEFVASGPVPI